MSSSVRVLVDDFDPRITYTPANKWTKGGGQFEHNSTTHGLADGTGSFSFKFNGTSVDLYATIPFTSTVYPNATCTVDGAKISSFVPSDSAYNYLHCQSPTLSDDQEHTLEVDIVSTTTAWYLDYLIYSSTVSEKRLVGPGDVPVQIMIDDADSRVVYGGPSGAWNLGGSQYEYNSTTHYTQTGGATATFKFHGSAVQVYGTVDSDKSLAAFTSTYAVDGGSDITYQPPTLDNYAVQMRFFQSSMMDEGDHTLVITDTTEGALKYILDFIVYSVTPSALVSAPTPSPSPSGSSDGDNNDTSGDSDKKSSNTGLIAGVSVGAVVILAGLALLVFFFLRRRRRNDGRPQLDLSTPPSGPHDAPLVQPFLDDGRRSTTSFSPYEQPQMSHRGSGWGSVSSSGPIQTGPATSRYATDSQYTPSESYQGDHQQGSFSRPDAPRSDMNSTYPSTSSYAASTQPTSGFGRDSIAATSTVPSTGLGAAVVDRPWGGKGPMRDAPTHQPQQHVDGGVRLAGDSDELDDLPPVYQASYSS